MCTVSILKIHEQIGANRVIFKIHFDFTKIDVSILERALERTPSSKGQQTETYRYS